MGLNDYYTNLNQQTDDEWMEGTIELEDEFNIIDEGEHDPLIPIDDKENIEMQCFLFDDYPQQDIKLLNQGSWDPTEPDNDETSMNSNTYEENPAVYLTDISPSPKLPTSNFVESNEFSDNETLANLTKQQTTIVDKLFTESTDVFAENISEEGQTMALTQTSVIEHTINTKDAIPIAQRAYRLAPSEHDFVQKEIEAMLDKEIIRPSKSP
jgi:hypothetical protein